MDDETQLTAILEALDALDTASPEPTEPEAYPWSPAQLEWAFAARLGA